MPPEQNTPQTLDESTLSRLMRLGLNGPRRPIDALLHRLECDTDEDWLSSAMGGTLPQADRRAIDHLRLRSATLEELASLKQRATLRLGEASHENERLRALLAYFLAVAGALALHRQILTRRSPAELESALLDLASCLSGSLQEIVSEAGVRAGSIARGQTPA